MRCRECDAKRGVAPQLEQLYSVTPSELNGLIDKRVNALVSSQRSTVVQEGHGHEIMPEDNTADTDERQYSNEFSVDIARG
jgi:hypothetical protein